MGYGNRLDYLWITQGIPEEVHISAICRLRISHVLTVTLRRFNI